MNKKSFQINIERSILDKIIGSDEAFLMFKNSSDDMLENFTGNLNDVNDLMKSVTRDIEYLLNTRRYLNIPEKCFEELQNSIYTYGLNDYTSENPSSKRLEEILKNDIQRTIETFEPRLTDISVESLMPSFNIIRFAIHAMLIIKPEYQPVYFDTSFNVSNKKYKVQY